MRVLIVDDNQDGADSLAWLVKSWEHEVKVAYDGKSALSVASSYLPDVVLLDLGMPQPDGFQIAQGIQKLDTLKDVLLIAVSGYTDKDHRQRAGEVGISCYLIKPTQPDTIQKLLAMRQKRIMSKAHC